MKPQKWELLNKKDISPSKWFPIEQRTYRMPNGHIVDDFTVSTLADVAMIVPITVDHKVVLVNQFKPGINEVILQFPAGRKEQKHANLLSTAQHELAEEIGAYVSQDQLSHFATLSGTSTKGSDLIYYYLAQNITLGNLQSLDVTEEIEIVCMDFYELDNQIMNGKILCALTIAGWEIVKQKFPNLLK